MFMAVLYFVSVAVFCFYKGILFILRPRMYLYAKGIFLSVVPNKLQYYSKLFSKYSIVYNCGSREIIFSA